MGRVIPVERNITGRGLHVQYRPHGCVYFSRTKSKIPNVCKFEMEGPILSASLPLLWFGTSPKDIHKVEENSHFSVEKTVCMADYFSGRYFLESRFSDKSQKKSTRATSEYTIFGYGNQLNRNDTVPSTRDEREDCATVPKSTGEVIS